MAKRNNPTEASAARKALKAENDTEYAALVLEPERKAVNQIALKTSGAILGVGTGSSAAGFPRTGRGEGVGSARIVGRKIVGRTSLAASTTGLLGTAIAAGVAHNRLNQAEKTIRLTKPAIDEAKSKNAESHQKKGR